nr:hypothetical protein [Nonomuraea terrae]
MRADDGGIDGVHPERALEISVDEKVPRLLSQLGQRAGDGGAGVVGGRVEPAEAADDLVDDPLRAGHVGGVGLDEQRLAAHLLDLLDHLAARHGPPPGDGHLGAFSREQNRADPADSGRAAGDQRHLSVQQSHDRPPWSLHIRFHLPRGRKTATEQLQRTMPRTDSVIAIGRFDGRHDRDVSRFSL